jgi:hypothetical protein
MSVLGTVCALSAIHLRRLSSVLIPEQAAHPFRNDGAPLFRSIAAQGSD